MNLSPTNVTISRQKIDLLLKVARNTYLASKKKKDKEMTILCCKTSETCSAFLRKKEKKKENHARNDELR